MTPKRTILIVEDDAGVREVLKEVLEDEGFDTMAAADGTEAVDLLQKNSEPPCVILLDLMMPRMSGSEFRMVQKVDPQLQHLPVVLLSADGAMEEKAKALETDGARRKPIDLEQLLQVIERFRDKAA